MEGLRALDLRDGAKPIGCHVTQCGTDYCLVSG
jgi:hypothetical protein